jgi:hypothetical protein
MLEQALTAKAHADSTSSVWSMTFVGARRRVGTLMSKPMTLILFGEGNGEGEAYVAEADDGDFRFG